MNCGIIPSKMKTKLKVSAVALMTGAALGCVTGLWLSCTRPRPSALKPIDQVALQSRVAKTAKELLIPGAVVLLRTPQGEFTVTYGTTLLGATSPPGADTHFRIASNTKTMTTAVIVLLAQEGKLSLNDPVSKYVGGCSFRNLTDKPYPPDIQAAVKAGTLKPDDCTDQNSSYASAAGGVISTANDCATWINALVGGKILNADY